MPKKKKPAKKKTVFKKPSWQKQPCPDNLYKTYLLWADDPDSQSKYKKLRKEINKLLGKEAQDPLEIGRLIVCLARIRLGSMTKDWSYD